MPTEPRPSLPGPEPPPVERRPFPRAVIVGGIVLVVLVIAAVLMWRSVLEREQGRARELRRPAATGRP